MVLLISALTYATLFVGLVLVFLPARVLEWSGVSRPAKIGIAQFAGGAIVVLGGGLALWCALTFVLVGPRDPSSLRSTALPGDVRRRPGTSERPLWQRSRRHVLHAHL